MSALAGSLRCEQQLAMHAQLQLVTVQAWGTRLCKACFQSARCAPRCVELDHQPGMANSELELLRGQYRRFLRTSIAAAERVWDPTDRWSGSAMTSSQLSSSSVRTFEFGSLGGVGGSGSSCGHHRHWLAHSSLTASSLLHATPNPRNPTSPPSNPPLPAPLSHRPAT